MSDRIDPAEPREDLIPAVMYLRCSSAQQELSVADQRREVEAYAARKGYRIVREYADEGKSASKEPEKRTAFNKMIADSAAGDFAVVVCYDSSRFSRLDNIDGSLPKQILRTNGVTLDTMKDGTVDWRCSMDRLKDTFQAEINKAASLNISRDSARGRTNVMKLGYWPNGMVPFGFDREYTDGVRKVFVRRQEQYRKGKGWHLRLVVNEEEAKVVRLVFDLLVERRWSLRQIGIHLTEAEVVPPQGPNRSSNGSWSANSVATILAEKAYIGTAVIGNRRRGRQREAHARIAKDEQANCCPAVVEARVWHEAQEVLRGRRDARSKPQSQRCGVLSGFVVCGHCGYRMCKREEGGRTKYRCPSVNMRPHLGCKCWAACEDELLAKALKWLVEAVDEAVVDAIQAQPPGEDGMTGAESLLVAQEEALARKVESGSESALLAPPNLREAAWSRVAEWREELESVRQRLALVRAVRNAPEFSAFDEWWSKVKEKIVLVETTRFHEGAGGLAQVTEHTVGDPSAVFVPVERDNLRALLSRMGFSCKVWWEEKREKRSRMGGFYVVKDVKVGAEIDLSNNSFMKAHNP